MNNQGCVEYVIALIFFKAINGDKQDVINYTRSCKVKPSNKFIKSIIAGAICAALMPLTASALTASEPYGDIAQALQMSIYFYDAEESGPSASMGEQRLEWRGDSEPSDAVIPLIYDTVAGVNLSDDFIAENKAILDPDGDGTVDLSGGFHDAGDHVKFGLPQAYAASTLGWGLYEFRDSYVKVGSYDHIMEELKWFTDYFLRSTFRDENGDVIAFNYMVGDGSTDHNFWGPPELQLSSEFARPATFAYKDEPASDQSAGASAALTLMYLNSLDTDKAYAEECLDNAKALYEFAVNNRGLGADDGFYNSSYDEDEMSWAAVWLYIATENTDYLDDIISSDANGLNTGYLGKIINSSADSWQNIWVHSWDTVWGGVFAKLATATEGYVPDADNDKFWYYFRWNLEYWSGGEVKHEDTSDSVYLEPSPAGFAVITTWGSARYNTAAQLSALVYRKHAGETEKAIQLTDWALSQMNYIMGNNPLERSYIVGYSDNYVQHPHHRAAHGGEDNSMLIPTQHKHVLWGALAAGPDTDDYHNDVITDYVYNEVAIDYNAGFVGALAGFLEYYVDEDATIEAWEPPKEEEKLELYTTSKIEQNSGERTQVTLQLNNMSSQPPKIYDSFSMRYFFNISELTEAGQSIADVSYTVFYDESSYNDGAATVTGPIAWDADNGIYYMDIAWKDISIWGDLEIQFALMGAQDSNWTAHWDSSNDWGFTDMTTSMDYSPYVPLYVDGELVYGYEPGDEVIIEPEDDVTDPDDGTTEPEDDITDPDDGTTEPEDEVTDPDDGTTEPEDEVTDPDDGTTEPEDEVTDPDDGTTEPEDEVTDPDEGTTEPEDDVTDPDDGTTEPEDEVTDPDDGTTEPDNGTTDPALVGAGDCSFDYSLSNQWNTGYIGNVTVTNDGDSAITSWEVTITYSDETVIVNSWNADMSGEAPIYTGVSQAWNGAVNAGDSVSWGLQASFDGSFEQPTLTGSCD